LEELTEQCIYQIQNLKFENEEQQIEIDQLKANFQEDQEEIQDITFANTELQLEFVKISQKIATIEETIAS